MKYYTYTHSVPDGKVFYVGKGKDGRVYSTSDRTLAWRKVVEDNQGVTMKIVKRFDNEEDAFAHEIELIAQYKEEGCELVNLTSGGKGVMDYCHSEESRMRRSERQTGYKHETVTCPHCGTEGGKGNMKRWHFDNCKGVAPKFKARVSLNGKRIHLGYFHTKEEADKIMIDKYKQEGVSIPKEFFRAGTGREHLRDVTLTIPAGESLVIL